MKRVFKTQSLSPNTCTQRTTEFIPSRTTPGGSTVIKEAVRYTGDKLVGISIIHKSCLQPIFSKEEAVSVAGMRR